MPRYRWIIFDADGTIFDYDRCELSALRSTFQRYGLAFDSTVHQEFGSINSRLWSEFEQGSISLEQLRVKRFEELANTMGFDYLSSRFSAHYLKALGNESTLFPGAFDVVKALSEDHGLVLATNGIAEVQHWRFNASDINQFFKSIVISDEIGVAKPDKRFFDKVFSMIGNPEKHNTFIVGDGLSSDIAGGAAYGIDTCWYNPMRRRNNTSVKPTYEIRDITEVLGIAGFPERPYTRGT